MKALFRPLRLLLLLALAPATLRGEDGHDLWLRYPLVSDAALLREYRAAAASLLLQGTSPTLVAARDELTRGLGGLLGRQVPLVAGVAGEGVVVVGTPSSSAVIASLPLAAELRALGDEGYLVRPATVGGHRVIVIAGRSDIGALYGAFAFLRQLQTHRSLASLDLKGSPRIHLRLLDHWDNLNGTIERGYAGHSLWQWDSLPGTLSPRYRDYARADASIGINGAVLTNVNANARVLTPEYLAKVAALANVFRPYGIRVYLTARFSAAMEIGGLKTADPLDPGVQAWWKAKADEIYTLIPDFGGFLVKANSEGQPGPQDYHRSHADGANMLADALGPHGGVVMWRAFVYSNEVPTDRIRQAYDEFHPLDGQFRPNVLVQVKNGPLDFQPREPFSPLFGGMPRTPVMMELQVTKEYLGQRNSLVFLAPMWKEVLDADTYAAGPGSTVAKVIDGSVYGGRKGMTGIAGVANVGDDRDWSGSDFNQANWFAFGRLAWDPSLTAARIAEDWIRMTFTNDPTFVAPVERMMLASRENAVNYMEPLGLAHQMNQFNAPSHFGPGPWQSVAWASERGEERGPPRPDWTPPYFSRADSIGIGFNRTAHPEPAAAGAAAMPGSDAVAQYHGPVAARFASRDSIPLQYLLFFHHVGWTERLRTGRTLWDELVHHWDEGVDSAQANVRSWAALKGRIDPERYALAAENLREEAADARWWRDASISYFQTLSKQPLPAGSPAPLHPLEWYEALRCGREPRCPVVEDAAR